MLKSYKIEKLKEKDLDEFLLIFKNNILQQFKEYSKSNKKFFIENDYNKENISNCLKQEKLIFLILKINKKIIGFLIGTHPYGGVSSIIWISINEEFQKRGMGSTLLKAYEKYIKKEKAHKVILGVTDKDNFNFYQKNGYKVYGELENGPFNLHTYYFYKNII